MNSSDWVLTPYFKRKSSSFFETQRRWNSICQQLAKDILCQGILCKSPSTNLSRKGNGVSDDSLDCITFSIAQDLLFCSLHQVIHLCGLAFGYRRFPEDNPTKEFQVCDDGAQYLLRLGQRVADSSLRWILRLQFCAIRLLSCEVSGYSCLNLQWERKRQFGCWTFMSYKIFVIKSKIKLTFLQIKCYLILFECFIKVYWELFSMPSFFSTFKMAFYCFTDLNAKTHHKCILLLRVWFKYILHYGDKMSPQRWQNPSNCGDIFRSPWGN